MDVLPSSHSHAILAVIDCGLVIGTRGVVLRSKEQGVIDEARPWVTKLMAAGMFIDRGLLEQALASIGE
jgi:predicted nucleic acid-binding protein